MTKQVTLVAVTQPTITVDQLNARTIKYYDDSVNKMKEMVEKLESLHSDLDRLNTDSNFAYTRMIDALGRIGQKIH